MDNSYWTRKLRNPSMADIIVNNRRSKGRFFNGISRVPYDGYRAILHEGERVITASKAKESERTKGGVNIGNINITASGAINDDETFARMLASQLEKALAAYAV